MHNTMDWSRKREKNSIFWLTQCLPVPRTSRSRLFRLPIAAFLEYENRKVVNSHLL